MFLECQKLKPDLWPVPKMNGYIFNINGYIFNWLRTWAMPHLVLSLTGCMTLDKLIDLSEVWLSYL